MVEQLQIGQMQMSSQDKLKLANLTNLIQGKKQTDIADFYKSQQSIQKRETGKLKEEGTFSCHGKNLIYDYRSLFLFHYQSKIRQNIVWLTEWIWFDRVIIACIIMNSIVMPFYEYKDRDNETRKNQIIEIIGRVFTGLFTFEAIFKIISMGFIFHRRSYLRDGWNWIDFSVVIIGVIEIIPNASGANLKALRTMRVLRPLKSINAIPKMRRLIKSLLSSIPELANAGAFLLFFFLLFDIFAIQSFTGSYYYFCRLTEQPIFELDLWPIDTTIERLCSGPQSQGMFQCPSNRYCGAPQDYNISLNNENISDNEIINYGLTTFDNLGYGLVTLFACITLEGWVDTLNKYILHEQKKYIQCTI